MISQLFWGLENLSFVGVICNFERAISVPIHGRNYHCSLENSDG
jgi:hypothetical protein